ncbi:MAG TPA: glycolate oxidase subunit GlcF [Rhizomicrobium sp.]|jgi:glycolate oxidase iron-sulfur subunit
MRTNFSAAQLADPHLAEAEKNLRACVHCGICTATCPTYVLLGDERDGPRGRIVMMQKMLEEDTAPSPETVTHIDRCLSCLGCRTACPSGVDYARLVDAAREHIEERYRRPFGERATRWLIANVLTRPGLARTGVVLAKFFAPVAKRLPGQLGRFARTALKAQAPVARDAPARGAKTVALMPGCVQQTLAPSIDTAIRRVLARRDIGTVPLGGCCGALAHHLGRANEARAKARGVIAQFEALGVESVTIGATGCSAHLLDYPHLFAGDPAWESRARTFAAKVRDFSTLTEPRPASAKPLRIAWQAPCSMQNGLRSADLGRGLLEASGYDVTEIPEGHLCCGSAGSYSLLQPELAGRLRTRKLGNIASLAPDAIATANIGCLMHLSGTDAPPIIHLAELIDWAEGGPKPVALDQGSR